ncbi:hypothetical protein RND71_029449 [Anisodus tanguticus]|uniref:Sucrose nonfermenting 4-like protein n=1 Tax=Anisodus tanguticus TaxID=243964 RepID=A0AAE1RFH0_9SOLA|nr:hypothetical protein RND71_029449 [Anisodus tanguticus]
MKHGKLGWSEQILMNLVEGSTVVFQRIVDVPPGYHKYKFLVDGNWQVDQEQLCVQDEYGAINNLVFVKESDSTPSALPRQDTLSKLVSGFARNMHLEGLAVMPLLDERNAMILGMLTASDFILILLKVTPKFYCLLQLHESHSMLIVDELEMHTVSTWKYRKFQLHAAVSGAMIPPNRRVLLQVMGSSRGNSLWQKCKISAVPILHSPEDGSHSQLLHTACLAGILKRVFAYNLLSLMQLFSPHNVFTRAYVWLYLFSSETLDICRHFRHSLEYLPLLQQPVRNLPLGTWVREVGGSCVLLTLHNRDLLSSALKLLIEGEISSIPIIDDNGALINVYSRSDITSLARGNVYARFRLDRMIMTQCWELLMFIIGPGGP